MEKKEEIKGRSLWIYIGGIILSGILIAVFQISKIKTLMVLGLIVIIFNQIVYNYKFKEENNKKNLLGWLYIIIYVFYLIIYLSSEFKEVYILIITILIFFILIIISSIVLHYYNLINSNKSTPLIIINYILLSFTIIILFWLFFILINSFNYGSLLNSNLEKTNNWKDFMSLSISNFYNINFGEIPTLWIKRISYIQIIISYIVHIILLGRVLNLQK